MANVERYEKQLGVRLHSGLAAITGVRVYGPSLNDGPRAGLCAFNVEGVHASDLATFLDQEVDVLQSGTGRGKIPLKFKLTSLRLGLPDRQGMAIRAGHHCTQPLHTELGAAGSARASLYVYNTRDDIDAFCAELRASIDLFRSFQS